MHSASRVKVKVLEAIQALAFIGDLSMGQPIDHSLRTAWLAGRLAAASGQDAPGCAAARCVALLRWSGCTANAPEFSELLGDDVGAREAMLASRLPQIVPAGALEQFAGAMLSLAQIHCEVSGEIASMLAMGTDTEGALRCIFEAYDGRGVPGLRQGDAVPVAVFLVSLASDLEIFSRVYGLEQALALIARKADRQYPAEMVDCVAAHAKGWLRALEDAGAGDELSPPADAMRREAPLELIADVIDLKLPWMTGFSRQAAERALACAARLGLDADSRRRAHRAALIHGIGRAAVPNTVWNTPGPLPASAWERVRLVPYWTARAARQIGALGVEAQIASFAYERADGSGYFRGAAARAIPIEARVVAAAVAWAALGARRPWRAPFTVCQASEHLSREAALGRFDVDVVRALIDSASTRRARAASKPEGVSLSGREKEVLHRISRGASNKEVARALEISPSTVRTHVESVFRKLGCSTRAAATLKAATLGLL